MEVADAAGAACVAHLRDLVTSEIHKPSPDIAKISVALGIVEASLTAKDHAERHWPTDLPAQVDECMGAFQTFISYMATVTASLDSSRVKIKAIADAIWSKLTGSFSKDILHAQHVYSFARLLLPTDALVKPARRHLDCAGVVTTTYAVCTALNIPTYLQISEDHCFLNLDPSGGRETSVEITADKNAAAKRGLPATEDLWRGWLYAGGHPVTCTPQQVVAALITSITPTLMPGKKGDTCERLEALQYQLLMTLRKEAPESLYPAALCALADLQDIAEDDEAEAAIESGDAAVAEAAADILLKRKEGDAQGLFEEAIALAAVQGGDGPSGGSGDGNAAGWQFYPYSYIVGHLCRRGELLETVAVAVPSRSEALRAAAVEGLRGALRWAAAAAGVLARYSFNPADEELYKDMGGGCLEYCVDGLVAYSKALGGAGSPALLEDSGMLADLLTYWDGVCVMFAARAKPAPWIAMILKAAKLFSADARAAAAERALEGARSGAMRRVRPDMWATLKPAVIKPLFEMAEVENAGAGAGAADGERAGKRARVSR